MHEDVEAGIYDQTIQEDSLPLCFESFQFLRCKLHGKSSNEKFVGNQQSLSFKVEDETNGEIFEHIVNKNSSPEMIDEIILDTEPDLQPPHTIQGQITDEGEATEIHDSMMQEDFVPLCYEAFQFIRQNLHNISKEKDEQPIGCHTVSIDTSQHSPQVFDDPFAHVLDSVCYKNSSPSTNHVTKEKLEESHQDAQETFSRIKIFVQWKKKEFCILTVNMNYMK